MADSTAVNNQITDAVTTLQEPPAEALGDLYRAATATAHGAPAEAATTVGMPIRPPLDAAGGGTAESHNATLAAAATGKPLGS